MLSDRRTEVLHIVLVLAMLTVFGTIKAEAATEHSLYGAVNNSSDGYAACLSPGTGFAAAYDVAESPYSDVACSNASATQMYDGYFLYDAGSQWSDWDDGEHCVVVIEINDAESGGHGNYTASTSLSLTNNDPDTFPSSTLEKMPTPQLHDSGVDWINITWTGLKDGNGEVVNYTVYRSTDNASFTFVGNSTPQVSNGAVYYNDTGLVGGPFYYKIGVRFNGGYESRGRSDSSSAISLQGVPNTTSWSNTTTNDDSPGITTSTPEQVTSGAAPSQSTTTWNQTTDVVDQGNNTTPPQSNATGVHTATVTPTPAPSKPTETPAIAIEEPGTDNMPIVGIAVGITISIVVILLVLDRKGAIRLLR